MRRFHLAAFAAAGLLWPAPAHVQETELLKARLPALPDGYWPRLEAGEVIVMQSEMDNEEDRSYGDVVELMLVDATPDEVFNVVEDCSRFPEFMPNLNGVALKDGEGDEAKVMAKLWEFQVNAVLFSVNYQIITLADRRNGVITWTLNPAFENEIKRTDGHWWLYPVDGGGRTLVVYAAKIESNFPLPQWIEEYVSTTAARDILYNTRERVMSGGKWKLGDDRRHDEAALRNRSRH